MADEGRKEVLSAGAGLAAEVALESGSEFGEFTDVKARGYWEQVWRRFSQDKIAIASGIFIVLLILTAFVGAPIAKSWLGHGPNDIFPEPGVGVDLQLVPRDPLTHAQWYNPETGKMQDVFFPLGTSDTLGRDLLMRLIYGARVSLEVALGATFLSMFIGVLLGATAGYFRGWIDALISRLTEIVMAFPLLLFVIALAATVGDRLDGVTFGFLPPGVVTLVLVGGVFGWFYPARIVRAQVLSLREKEFIEAARMVGLQRLADHPVAPAASPGRADHRLLDPDRRPVRPLRGRPLVPRPRRPAAGPELGEPARGCTRVLPPTALVDVLARRRRAADDAGLQPARRRPARRLRSARRRPLEALLGAS